MDSAIAFLLIPLPVFGLLTPFVDQLSRKFFARNVVPYWTLTAILATLLASLNLLRRGFPVSELVFGVLSVDAFSIYFSIIFLAVAAFVNVASIEYMKAAENQETYYGLLLLATLGMILVALATDLVVLFIAWELMSIPTYVLTGILKKDPISNEAAVKYFILSALSSALIVYAISLAFGVSGTTNIYKAAQGLASAPAEFRSFAVLSVVLFIAGFGMKIAAVPFHMWVPDAYEGAPTTIGAFLAAGTKNGGFAAILRVFSVALPLFRIDWSAAFALLAILTMTLGNVAALMQRSLPRLLAYSSIAHSGYILIGLAAPSSIGISGALYHILNHAVMKSSAFIAAAAVFAKLSTTSLDGYSGLGRRMPLTSLMLSFSLLALAGIPPLNGFMSKLVLFTAAIDAKLWWLALAGVLNSAFSLAYYGWIMKRMYMDEAPASSRVAEPLPFTLVLAVSTILIVVTGVYPEPILAFTRAIAVQL